MAGPGSSQLLAAKLRASLLQSKSAGGTRQDIVSGIVGGHRLLSHLRETPGRWRAGSSHDRRRPSLSCRGGVCFLIWGQVSPEPLRASTATRGEPR